MQTKPFLEKDYIDINTKKNITSWSSLLRNHETQNVSESKEHIDIINRIDDPEYKNAVLKALYKQKIDNIESIRIKKEEEEYANYYDTYNIYDDDDNYYNNWCDEHYETDIAPTIDDLYESLSCTLQPNGIYTYGSKLNMENWLFNITDMPKYMNVVYNKHINKIKYFCDDDDDDSI